MECPTCAGLGKFRVLDPNGTARACSDCNGTGRKKDPKPRQAPVFKLEPEAQEQGSATATKPQPCRLCRGTGEETCFQCNGGGQTVSSSSGPFGYLSWPATCGRCSGSGKITCRTCSGSDDVSASRPSAGQGRTCPGCFGKGLKEEWVPNGVTMRLRYRQCGVCGGRKTV
jgi:DnaJ-class molecular chaperone